MGWAKYMEDNLEIMESRLRYYHNSSYITSYSTPIAPSGTSDNEFIDEEVFINELILSRPLYCLDCGRRINFTTEQKKYYEQRGWRPPKRCKKCRDSRSIRCVMRPSF